MPHPCKSFHRLRFLTHPFCLPSTGLCFWPGVRLVVTFCPPPILWLLAPLVLSILLALLLVSWCISTFCALKLSPPIALGNSSQRMVLCIGHPLGSNFSLCLWTVRPLTRAGKFVMESCIQLLSCLLLDTTIQLHVFVVCLWRLVSISSSLVHWPRVLWIGSSLCCLMLVLRPALLARHILFGFNPDELRAVPRLFVYLLQVCKYHIWLQRNDFRFRSERPTAVSLIPSIKSRVKFYLPLFAKRFRSQRRRRFFVRQWGTNSLICSLISSEIVFSWAF